MPTSGFIVSEEKSSALLTLIVDKKGIFGPYIAKKIHENITTVLVTAREEKSHGNTLVIPYNKPIPEIPEGNYTHIVFVWDGRVETLHLLEPLLQKAALDNARFLFVTDYHFQNEKLARFIHQEYSKACVIFVGDVFENVLYESLATKFFQEAREKGIIQLENVGLKHMYPVAFEDVVGEIVKIVFGTEKGKMLLACQRHGMTELSFVHVLQKVDPLLKIDFKKLPGPEAHQPLAEEGEYLFDASYDVVRKIQNAYADFIASKHTKQQTATEAFFSPMAVHKEKTKRQKRKKKWVILGLIAVFLLISPILFALVYVSLGGIVLYEATTAIRTGQFTKVQQLAKTSQSLFQTAQSANTYASGELNAFFLGGSASALTSGIQTGQVASILLEDMGSALTDFSHVSKGVSVAPAADFLSGIQSIKNALITLTQSHLTAIAGIPLSEVTRQVQPLGGVLDVSPTLFGFPEKKTYMVLFQNNMELRPGGGFIGSYALATIDQGRVTDFTIHNVYDADGQLKGHVEPPYVIRRYIPQVNWYLRDSNFDVDFSQDAANAAFFLQQETGEKIDGVIGVDLSFVKDILALTGAVYVPEYNQVVSSDNLFLLTETHADKNSFAGSTQKQDFLSALFAAMQKKLTSGNIASPKAVVGLLGAIESKDIVFGFSDPLIQDVFTINGLSSSLWDERKQGRGVVNDITGINEANIGVDKANYFVTRAVQQAMSISPTGSVSGKLTITYTNSSKNNQWPGGDYKNYLRLLLPSGATIQSIQVNNTLETIVPAITDFHVYEAKGFTPPKGLEVDSSAEKGKQLYGFVTIIPAGKTQTIYISYTLPSIDSSSPTVTYNGWLFKQPGVDAYPYTFTLSVPSNFSLLQKPDWIQGEENAISFQKEFGEDTQFSVVFSQK